MIPQFVVGVDPSIRAAGLILLELSGQPEDPGRAAIWSPGPQDVRVLRRATIRPSDKLSTAERVRVLYIELTAVADWPEVLVDTLFAIEDPTNAVFGRRGAGGAAAKVGAAFGAAYCAIADVVEHHSSAGSQLVAVPSERWLPRARGRRGSHPMLHEQARRWLAARWPALDACTDDETFAAGVALYALTRRPMVVAA